MDNGQEVLVRRQRGGRNGDDSFTAGERVVLTWADDAALRLD
jgi:hypothetical protein